MEAAYTLGRLAVGIVRRVLLPAAAPQIAETLRLVLGWAWTYVIVAELIGASSGIGHMIMDSQRLLDTGQMIFGIVIIGVIGLVSDFLFKWANRAAVSPGPCCEQARGRRRRAEFPGLAAARRRAALEPTDLDVADNDFIAILGPSGCGKSTLLRIVAGPRPADTGRGAARRPAGHRPGPRPRHGVPVLHAFPVADREREHLLRLREQGVPPAEQRQRADASSTASACAASRTTSRSMLSGGMQQRTALARALANDPEILLLDEPFGALDNQTRALMQELLLGIWEADRKTVLFVTHDIDEAIFLANRVVVMSARPGRIKAEVAVPLPHPRDSR